MAQFTGIRKVSRARNAITEARELLRQMQKPELADKLTQLEKDLNRERFTVAVVGEFSRGKSTLINRMLGRELLPVGNMPTTAMLTRIRAGAREGMVYVDEKGRRSQPLALKQQSWDGLVANNFGGPDPQGAVYMSVASQWLAKWELELLDTPGAGDLEERRAQKISDALLEADGAIIAISALSPMSMSEQQFIQQRLITRKTPFMLLAVTKLDEIPEDQRPAMLQFIQSKLKLWKMDVPVFVAGDVAVPGDSYRQMVGIDKLRTQVEHWVSDPKRQALTDRWVLAKVDDVLATAEASLAEQLRLLALDGEKREAAIAQKREQLQKVHEVWEALRREMKERGDKCATAVLAKAAEYQENTVQRLRYEVSRTGQPASWWRQDFGYRLRVELAGMASGLDGLAGRLINEDMRWLNARLDKSFKTTLAAASRGPVADKEMFGQVAGEELNLENLESQRSISRIATTALTIIGSLTLSSMGLGMFNIMCTSGVGTGSALLTEKFFKAKTEKQREVVARAIELQVPKTVEEAMAKTRSRLNAVYADILQAATEKEASFMEAQNKAIDAAAQSEGQTADGQTQALMQQLKTLRAAVATAAES